MEKRHGLFVRLIFLKISEVMAARQESIEMVYSMPPHQWRRISHLFFVYLGGFHNKIIFQYNYELGSWIN